MKMFSVAVTALALIAGGAAYGVSSLTGLSGGEAGFERGCREGMKSLIDAGREQARRRGQSPHMVSAFTAGYVFGSICSCGARALKTEFDDDEYAVAGELFSVRMQLFIAKNMTDRESRQSLRNTIEQSLERIVVDHGLPPQQMGPLYSRVEQTLQQCWRQKRAKR